jgi:hypothetical protein
MFLELLSQGSVFAGIAGKQGERRWRWGHHRVIVSSQENGGSRGCFVQTCVKVKYLFKIVISMIEKTRKNYELMLFYQRKQDL